MTWRLQAQLLLRCCRLQQLVLNNSNSNRNSQQQQDKLHPVSTVVPALGPSQTSNTLMPLKVELWLQNSAVQAGQQMLC